MLIDRHVLSSLILKHFPQQMKDKKELEYLFLWSIFVVMIQQMQLPSSNHLIHQQQEHYQKILCHQMYSEFELVVF